MAPAPDRRVFRPRIRGDIAGALVGVEMGAEPEHTSSSRVVLAGAIGNAIEFYDFTVYAFLAGYFAAQFFPSTDPIAGLLASYATLAIGMIMRPVGGVLLGFVGDRLSRAPGMAAIFSSPCGLDLASISTWNWPATISNPIPESMP